MKPRVKNHCAHFLNHFKGDFGSLRVKPSKINRKKCVSINPEPQKLCSQVKAFVSGPSRHPLCWAPGHSER